MRCAEAGLLGNGGKRWRLVDDGASLRRGNDVAGLAPAMREPRAVVGVRSLAGLRKKRDAQCQASSDESGLEVGKHLTVPWLEKIRRLSGAAGGVGLPLGPEQNAGEDDEGDGYADNSQERVHGHLASPFDSSINCWFARWRFDLDQPHGRPADQAAISTDAKRADLVAAAISDRHILARRKDVRLSACCIGTLRHALADARYGPRWRAEIQIKP